jgi:predicted dehydrogenase/aryl-alcohol dehydrogenase-like predicted oxidoreductase
MSKRLQWGILAAGGIAGAFANGVKHSKHGNLAAVASRSKEKAEKFGEQHAIPKRYVGYEEMLKDPEVEAVYVATPHPMHAEWAIKCAEAGKHILCEKPLTINAATAMAVIEAARRNDVFLMEAFMYRCNAQTKKLVELLRNAVIGEVRLIRASFSFHAGYNLQGRILNNALGGGGILDVGCYATSMSRLIAGVALGGQIAEPIKVTGAGRVGKESTVDEYAAALLTFPNDIVAQVATGVQLGQDNDVRIFGSEGNIVIPSPWFCSGHQGGKSTIIVNRKGKSEEVVIETDEWLYGAEADHVAENIERRQGQFPAMTWDDTLGNMRTLDRWRESFGMVYDEERPEKLTVPVYGRPLVRRPDHKMKYGRIPGLDKDISRVVMGADNQGDIRHASVMWDDFIELGGNCFDTARIYGPMESVVGQWVKNRGIRKDVVLITKGAHTPGCYPDNMRKEFRKSLEMLQTDYVDIYFLHRDNLEVPVGEFVDVLNEHKDAGKIRVFGGSNWTLERVQAANEYAAKHGKTGFGAVSNNFSLARMIDGPWAGCVASSDPKSRKWLTDKQLPLFSWSSQARGFFIEGRANPDNKSDKELLRCWYSEDNFERQRHAFQMAKEKGVLPVSIALAYVLCQPFPAFPLIGPRSLHETTTSLLALDIQLTPKDLRWLDLEG